MKSSFRVAIAGATGLVGREIVRVLEDRDFPVEALRLFASEQSVGETIDYLGTPAAVEVLTDQVFQEGSFDFVFFATSSELSAHFVPLALKAGAFVIDNSSHFRLNPEIPLIVPEVNFENLLFTPSFGSKRSEGATRRGQGEIESGRLIANPNCSTIQLVAVLKPLHEEAELKRVVVSTYQSVSGAGQAALEELENQIRQLYAGEMIHPQVLPHQIAFNCIPHIDVFQPNGFSKEEMKIMEETRKILGLPQLKITATAVRVPTLFGHGESVNVEFVKEISPEKAREVLQKSGIVVQDNPGKNLYPLNGQIAGKDEVFVGRIRKDESVVNGLHLWIVADNIRKGAATNAVQIAEMWIKSTPS